MTDYCMSSIMTAHCRYFQRIAFQESVSSSGLNQQRSAGKDSPGGDYESESESGRRKVGSRGTDEDGRGFGTSHPGLFLPLPNRPVAQSPKTPGWSKQSRSGATTAMIR